MTRKIPDIRIRGIRQKIPANYLIGRASKGDGKAQLISPQNLKAILGLSPAQILSNATIQQLLDKLSATQGSVLYRGSAAWAALGPGTTGDFLKTNGAAANPTWASAGSGSSVGWFPAFTTPVDGDFAWTNQGGASVTVNANGGIYLLDPAGAGNNIRIRDKNVPSAPYTITACFIPLTLGVDFGSCGLCLHNGTGVLVFGPVTGDTLTDWKLESSDFTNVTTFSAFNVQIGSFVGANGSPVWLRITDDNANRILSFSYDGYNFTTVLTEARTTFITPTKIGFFVNGTNATWPCATTLLSWAQS
jgi:hypothetical protein